MSPEGMSAPRLAAMRRDGADGQYRHVMLFELDEHIFKPRAPGQHVGESRALGNAGHFLDQVRRVLAYGRVEARVLRQALLPR